MENRIKGMGIRGIEKTVIQLAGQEGWERVLSAAEKELGDSLRYGSIIPSGWYPMSWYRNLHIACQAGGVGGADLPRRLGYENTYRDLTSGAYRLLLMVASPEFLISKAPLVFHKYYEHGTMVIDVPRKGMATAKWSACIGFDVNVWADLVGGCEGSLVAAGAKDVKAAIVSGGRDGDTTAEMLATWS